MLVSIVADRRLRLLGQLLPTLFLLLLLAGGASALAAETRQQSCGGSIQYGDSEQHYNHADWPHCDYWFQGDEGDRVTVHVQVQRGGLRPQLLLGDSNGRIIAQTTGTALSHVLNAGDGEYVLRLTSADNPRNYGFFTIWLQEPVAQKYRELGGSNSFLGAPSITERSTPDGAGRFRHYAGGSIYFHPTTGAHEVHGAIRNRWS
ncbi:MAG TPA: hypothetical protein PL105_17010, partial [Caldilineaceae bacterium]|nr:hypothetical protein [Caldilineaceae bacterium]